MSDAAPIRARRRARRRAAALVLLAAGLGVRADATLRDPTRPPVLAAPAQARAAHAAVWRLTSTLISPQRRIAVINRRTVEAGQRVDGAVVVWIGPGRARVRHNGREITLHLLPGAVKTPAGRAAPPEREGGDP